MAALLRFASAAAAAATASAVFTLYKVDPAPKNAVCLDGTPGAFYFSPGSGENATKWMVHFEGGGALRERRDFAHTHTDLAARSAAWRARASRSGDTPAYPLARAPRPSRRLVLRRRRLLRAQHGRPRLLVGLPGDAGLRVGRHHVAGLQR